MILTLIQLHLLALVAERVTLFEKSHGCTSPAINTSTNILSLDNIKFPSQAIDFCLWHVIHIRKACVSAVNLSYPVMRQIFGNTVGLIYRLDLALCLINV